MLYARDFRRIAADALNGNWGIAVAAGIIAGLLGGSTNNGFGYTYRLSERNYDTPGWLISFILLLVFVEFLIGGAISLGYARFNKKLIDGADPKIEDVFSGFRIYWKGFIMKLLISIYTFLWSLLFIIPGIVASYSYSMTPYILDDNPDLFANEAIKQSVEMMRGNKGRLFCLDLSFIGWAILCVFTCGIGYLWLTPYISASHAAFYREMSGKGNTQAAYIDNYQTWQDN